MKFIDILDDLDIQHTLNEQSSLEAIEKKFTEVIINIKQILNTIFQIDTNGDGNITEDEYGLNL